MVFSSTWLMQVLQFTGKIFPVDHAESIMCLLQPVNTFIITARECSNAIAQNKLRLHPGLKTWLSVQFDSLRTELVVATLKFMTWWSGFRLGFGPKSAA